MTAPSQNHITVPIIHEPVPNLSNLSDQLDSLESHWLKTAPWTKFAYRPEVQFAIAHTTDFIYLKFYVQEQSVRAQMTHPNEPVYNDSCVEFFVAPANDSIYYNFEFNCIGTCLAQMGPSRENRQFLDKQIIEMIQTQASLGKSPIEERQWEENWTLTVALPKHCFVQHSENVWSSKIMRANFYKCGDGLSTPHYLTWKPIQTNSPDFHRPEFFGELHFD